MLKQAILLAIHRTSDYCNEYPILKKVDILLALQLAHMASCKKEWIQFLSEVDFNSETVTVECRNKIVNHLSRMAGATILEYGTNELIWSKIMAIIYALMFIPSQVFLIYEEPKYLRYAGYSKDDIDLYNDPVPLRQGFDIYSVATIVPKDIEDSANKLGLSYDRVYGSSWLLSEGRTLEEEIEAAKEEYFIKEEDDPFSESEGETSTGSMSISDEESCDDDYSVYSDNKCPDF